MSAMITVSAMIHSVLRHILTFGAGYLVSRGYLDEATSQQAIGYLVGLGGVLWGIYEKYSRR